MTQHRSLRQSRLARLVCAGASLLIALPAALFSGVSPATATSVSSVGGISDLFSVSCAPDPYCLAGGIDRSNTTDPNATPVIASATSGSPGAAMTVPGLYDVLGVGCASATVCLAVGAIRQSQGSIGGVAQITDGKPGSAVAVAGTTGLRSVACFPQSTSCVAVGDSSSAGSGAVVPITNGQVGAAQTVSGASNLTGVSCMDATHCVAVGGFNQDVNTHDGVVVPITNGVAGGTQDVSAASVFNGVGCAAGTTTCLAVGAEQLSQNENGSVGVVEPIVSGSPNGTGQVSGTNSLYGAACADASHCYAVGEVQGSDSSHHTGVVVPVSGGTSGAVEQVSGTFDLLGVSCQSSDTCVAAGYSRSGTSPGVDSSKLVLIGVGGAVQGPFFSKEKQDAQADLGPALKNAVTYCTPTALGLTGFGAGVLLTGVGTGGALAVAGALTAYATAPFCTAVITRLVKDYRRYKDPADPSYDQLANPAPIAAVNMPSCSRWSGSAVVMILSGH